MSVSALAMAAPLLLLSASDCLAQQIPPRQSNARQSNAQQIPITVQQHPVRVSTPPIIIIIVAPPDLSTIVGRMVQAHAEEVAQRRAYNLIRNYRIYEGSTSTPKSEITAAVTFLPPQSKSYAITQSTGGIAERMVRKALEREVDLSRDPQVSQLVPANYDFEFAGEDILQAKRCYVLLLHPKRNSKDLLKGRIWVDAERFIILQVEGEPAESPSFWLKNVHLLLTYADLNGMWLQTGTEASAHVRMAGDYKMVSRDVSFASAETVSELIPAAPLITTSAGKPSRQRNLTNHDLR